MSSSDSIRQRIAIGIVFSRDRRHVLISRRPDNVHQGGLWEFPGGKVEKGESEEEALVRELKEEININAMSIHPLKRFNYDYPDAKLVINVRIVDEWSGDVSNRKGLETEWVRLDKIKEVNFPAANREIIRALLLPEIYFITPAVKSYDRVFLRKIEMILDKGIKMLRFRSPALHGDKRLRYAESILELCRKHGCRFIYDGPAGDVVKLGADGLHLNSSRLLISERRPLGKEYYLAVSCHNDTEIRKAAEIDADFCVLGPVRSTTSHVNGIPLGWENFSDLAELSNIPVFALGGMKPEDLYAARHHHAHGIAMISGLWNNT